MIASAASKLSAKLRASHLVRGTRLHPETHPKATFRND